MAADVLALAKREMKLEQKCEKPRASAFVSISLSAQAKFQENVLLVTILQRIILGSIIAMSLILVQNVQMLAQRDLGVVV